MHKIGPAVIVMLVVGSCEPARFTSPPRSSSHNDARIKAASIFTERYARSRLSEWNIRGQAAGDDCSVLIIKTPVIMEDSMVEAMHYGAGAYDIYDGGVQRFSRDRTFRGVAYQDGSGRLWTYGAVTQGEVEALKACH